MFDPDRYVAALRFAAQKHQGQKMLGSDLPYLVHVTSVAAEVIAALPSTPTVDANLAIACALLHDTIEDTATSPDEITEHFGAAIAAGVQALSKNEQLPTKQEQMLDSLTRIQRQPHAIWIVKLADRITNLAPPPSHWTTAKCQAYRTEAQAIADALRGASPALDHRIRARIASYAAYCGPG